MFALRNRQIENHQFLMESPKLRNDRNPQKWIEIYGQKKVLKTSSISYEIAKIEKRPKSPKRFQKVANFQSNGQN